jgi:uncharacterized protein YggT (Ycf19 family)
MADSYDREVVRQETTSGEPVSSVSPVTTSRTSVSSHSYPSYTNPTIAIIWWVVGLLDTLIAIRFLLKLFGANTTAAFVRFMYDLTAPLVAPFHGIFNTTAEGRSIFEPESIVAIIIYTLVGWGIVSLIRVLSRNRRSTTVVD